MGKLMAVNWVRVIANGIIAFCVPAIAALSQGSTDALQIGMISAVIYGLMAIGLEMQKESENAIPTESLLIV